MLFVKKLFVCDGDMDFFREGDLSGLVILLCRKTSLTRTEISKSRTQTTTPIKFLVVQASNIFSNQKGASL